MVHRRVVFISRNVLIDNCDTIHAGSEAAARDGFPSAHPDLPEEVLLEACRLLAEESIGDGEFPLPHDWRLEASGTHVKMVWGDRIEGGPHEASSRLSLPASYRRTKKRPPESPLSASDM